MQALWSRAAQTRSFCRCSSCLHATGGALARRTTTATTKRFKIGDIFTACYSTILATALLADTRVKDERRKQWDRVIAEAKAGNTVDDASIPQSTLGQEKAIRRAEEKLGFALSYYPVSHGLGSWNDTSWAPPKLLSRPARRLRMIDHKLNSLIEAPAENFDGPFQASNSSLNQTGDWYDEDDVAAHPSDCYEPREPLRKEHKRTAAETVRNLVKKLLLDIDILSITSIALTSASTNLDTQTIQLAQRVDDLQEAAMPVYSEALISQEQRTALHKALVNACENTILHRSNIELLVMKICYNLLVSTTPPNIGTYNILIREFTRLQQYRLTQHVIDSFFQNVMKPNERTIKLLLDHYTVTGNPAGFRQTVKRMSGTFGNMGIRKMNLHQLAASPDNLRWALENRVILADRFPARRSKSWLPTYTQKVDRSPDIFESLIRGSFELRGLRAAIRYIRAAFREGHMVHSRCIYNVVEACMTQLDYRAARSLLEVILLAWETGHTSLISLSPDFRYAFYRLLAVCNINQDSVSTSVVPPFVSLQSIKNFLLCLHIESIEESINRCRDLVLALGEVVRQITERISPRHEGITPLELSSTRIRFIKDISPQDIMIAFGILKSFWEGEQEQATNKRKHQVEHRILRFRLLEIEIDDLAVSVFSTAKKLRPYLLLFRFLEIETELDDLAVSVAGTTEELQPYLRIHKLRLLETEVDNSAVSVAGTTNELRLYLRIQQLRLLEAEIDDSAVSVAGTADELQPYLRIQRLRLLEAEINDSAVSVAGTADELQPYLRRRQIDTIEAGLAEQGVWLSTVRHDLVHQFSHCFSNSSWKLIIRNIQFLFLKHEDPLGYLVRCLEKHHKNEQRLERLRRKLASSPQADQQSNSKRGNDAQRAIKEPTTAGIKISRQLMEPETQKHDEKMGAIESPKQRPDASKQVSAKSPPLQSVFRLPLVASPPSAELRSDG